MRWGFSQGQNNHGAIAGSLHGPFAAKRVKDALDGLSAELAAGGGEGDVAEALSAGLGGDGLGCGCSLEFGDEVIGGRNDEEVDDRGQHEEGDEGVEEVAVGDCASVDVEDEGGEVWFADYGCDEGSDDVFDERVDDGAEGCADDDGYGEVEDVAAEDEVAKAFDQGNLLSCEVGNAWGGAIIARLMIAQSSAAWM